MRPRNEKKPKGAVQSFLLNSCKDLKESGRNRYFAWTGGVKMAEE